MLKIIAPSRRSAPGTSGQNAEVKSRAAIKDACSSGPETSTDSSRTMQKRADKKARSSSSFSPSSQEYLMKTSSAEDEKRYSACQLCNMVVFIYRCFLG